MTGRAGAPAAATDGPDAGRLGRPPVTSRAHLGDVGLQLFTTRGFEATSVDDIAAAAGVSRRTFFRYFAAKADVVWGDFDDAVDRMRADLAATADELPMLDALRGAIVRFNRVPDAEVARHRARMHLILEVPEVIARSTVWYATWRHAVVEFAARRLGVPEDDLLPRTIGHCALGAAVAAYEQWLRDGDVALEDLLERGFRALAIGFDAEVGAAPAGGRTAGR